jgi:hypothetical protein
VVTVKLPAKTVVVCETNKTRADLYGLWLDDYEPRCALTSAQFAEAFDAGVAVTVLDHSFGDGAAASVLERVDSVGPHCRVLRIRDRSNADPASPYDRQIERPVFEADLSESVETLLCRANYHLLLDKYYRTTVLISTYEWQADDAPTDERYERLQERAERLQKYLNGLRPRMDDDDVHAVANAITLADVANVDSETPVESKYRPDECARCGQDWSEPIDGDEPAAKLGAYVWRCANCGHVDMRGDPSHRHVSPSNR